MRRMMLAVSALTLGMLVNVLPSFCADSAADKKDECLLIARDCGYSAKSIQDKIDRLNEEIAKGTAVYTPEELTVLKQKLDEVNKTLDFLGNKPPYPDEGRK